MQHPSNAILIENLGDFEVELFSTQKDRYYAKALHTPSNTTHISETFDSVETAVAEAMKGCIELLGKEHQA